MWGRGLLVRLWEVLTYLLSETYLPSIGLNAGLGAIRWRLKVSLCPVSNGLPCWCLQFTMISLIYSLPVYPMEALAWACWLLYRMCTFGRCIVSEQSIVYYLCCWCGWFTCGSTLKWMMCLGGGVVG